MKAIIIARVSTEEQKEAGNSLPAQVVRLEQYCQNKGFEIIERCSFDESAYKKERNEFDQIIDCINKQKEKVAVCFDKVDRLSRNVFDKRVAMLYENAITDVIELHFSSDGQIINSQISSVEKFQFSMSLGLAKYYSDAISDNVKRANEQKLRKGEWTGKAPTGYKNITLPDNKKGIVVDELLAPLVKECFELYASGAYSAELLREKMKKDYSVTWAKSFMDKLFNNHFYYGVMIVKEKQYPHHYPKIISKDLFDLVQHVRSGFNNKRRYKYAGIPNILYRGVFRCGNCGLAVTAERQKGIVYYHCTQYNGKHGATWFREDVITKQLAGIFKRLQMPEAIFQEILITLTKVHQNKIDFHNKHFDRLTKELKDVTKMFDTLYFDKLKGRITEEAYDRHYKTLCDQRDDIKTSLDGLEEAENNYYVTSKHILSLCSQAHELFIGSKVEQKRQLIKTVLSNLKIEGEKIVYEGHKPFDLILNCSETKEWRPLIGAFREQETKFTVHLCNIQTLFSSFGLLPKT